VGGLLLPCNILAGPHAVHSLCYLCPLLRGPVRIIDLVQIPQHSFVFLYQNSRFFQYYRFLFMLFFNTHESYVSLH
jgi:hypothetical protein